jgi:hypothetical protein
VGIFWDIDCCGVSGKGGDAEVVATNIRDFAMKHGTIRTFCAFGDFGRIPADIRRALQQSGISTLDTSSGRKDAADKAIIVELCFFAVDHQVS